jgi:hypothetical protein
MNKKTGKKLRQNFGKLLEKNVEKMSAYLSLAMLMKPKGLKSFSGDVYENKWLGGKIPGAGCQGRRVETAYTPSQSR